jgi:hypothetical protein
MLRCEDCGAVARFNPKQPWKGGDPRRQPWERFDVSCEDCGAEAGFNPKQPWKGGDPRRQPWERSDDTGRSKQQEDALILDVSDPRLFYPRIRSGLIIPPESRVRRGTVLDRLYCNRADQDELERARNDCARGQRFRSLASRYGCSPEEIEHAWYELREKRYPPVDGGENPRVVGG